MPLRAGLRYGVESTAVAETVVVDQTLVRAAHENFAEAYRIIARALPGGLVESWPGAELTIAGVAQAEYNRMYVFERPGDPVGLIERARKLFGGLGLPWMLIASSEAHAAFGNVTFEHGLGAGDSLPGMIRAAWDEEAAAVAGLEIEEVTSAALAEIFVATLAAGFRSAREPLAPLAHAGVWDAVETRSFIGWMDGEAVGTSTCVITGAVAGIYNVSVRRGWLRRGVGRAMTVAAGQFAWAGGSDYLSLQATQEGLPLYQAMGFQRTTVYRTWYSFR